MSLEIRELNFSHDSDTTLLNALSFIFEEKRIYFLQGKSGSGKSTLLRCISLLCGQTQDSIFLNGKALNNTVRYRSQVIYLPQTPPASALSVKDYLLLPFSYAIHKQKSTPNDSALKEALAEVDLSDIPLNRNSSELSGGQKQRLALSRALLLEPKFLLCDEIVAGLDKETVSIISTILTARSQKGLGIIFTSHQNFFPNHCVTRLTLANKKLELSHDS